MNLFFVNYKFYFEIQDLLFICSNEIIKLEKPLHFKRINIFYVIRNKKLNKLIPAY